MPCFKPLHGYKALGGGWTANHAQSLTIPLAIPCGQCIGCRTDRKNEWALRLTHESRLHDQSMFVTLTYDDSNVPNGYTLDKSHVQLFHKRLANHLRRNHLTTHRYFTCGEYGDQKKRPHYHSLVFGYWPSDAKKERGGKHPLWSSQTIENIWGKGHITFGDVTPETCKYVSHYTVKKFTGPMAKEKYTVMTEYGELVEQQPEFALMSRRPGIGAGLYLKHKGDFRNSDFALLMGKKLPIPRYYDKLQEREDAKKLDDIKYQRALRARKHKDNNTPERLAVRETVAKSKLRSNTRKDIQQ